MAYEKQTYYNRSGAPATITIANQVRGPQRHVVEPLGSIDLALPPHIVAGKCPQLSLTKPPPMPAPAEPGGPATPTPYDLERAAKARSARVAQYGELSEHDLRDIYRLCGLDSKDAIVTRKLEIAAEETGETDQKKLSKAAKLVKLHVGLALAEMLVRFEEAGENEKAKVEEARREVALRVGGRQDTEVAVVDEEE